MTEPIEDLRGLYTGETITIVGSGPSILSLRQEDIPDAPLIALNEAILTLRPILSKSIPVYTMQKDGCIPHTAQFPKVAPPGHECAMNPQGMTAPLYPEVLLVHAHESPWCFMRYTPRYVFDCQADFGMQWWRMSAPVAVEVAHLMGANRLVMLGHDAYAYKDLRRVSGGDVILDPQTNQGYVQAGQESHDLAIKYGMAIEFR